MSGAPDQVSDDEIPIPGLHATSPLLPVLLLPRLPTVTMKIPFQAFQIVLLWFGGVVMLRFLSRAPAFLLHLPSYCSPSTCPADWLAWPMPSQVWLIPMCFFFFRFLTSGKRNA
jgi:hypothetical protein